MHPPTTLPIIDTKSISRFGKIADVMIQQTNTNTIIITVFRNRSNLLISVLLMFIALAFYDIDFFEQTGVCNDRRRRHGEK